MALFLFCGARESDPPMTSHKYSRLLLKKLLRCRCRLHRVSYSCKRYRPQRRPLRIRITALHLRWARSSTRPNFLQRGCDPLSPLPNNPIQSMADIHLFIHHHRPLRLPRIRLQHVCERVEVQHPGRTSTRRLESRRFLVSSGHFSIICGPHSCWTDLLVSVFCSPGSSSLPFWRTWTQVGGMVARDPSPLGAWISESALRDHHGSPVRKSDVVQFWHFPEVEKKGGSK